MKALCCARPLRGKRILAQTEAPLCPQQELGPVAMLASHRVLTTGVEVLFDATFHSLLSIQS